MKVKRSQVIEKYELLLGYAQRAAQRESSDLLLRCIETLSYWLYHTGLKFSSSDLDVLVERAVENLQLSARRGKGSGLRVVFFDYFGWDNRNLTEQYLSCLAENGIDFCYVNLNSDKKFNGSKIERLLKETGCKYLAIRKNMSSIEKVRLVIEFVDDFSPSHILFQTAPWDVVAPVLSCVFVDVLKININITDHAFWLGAGLFDYSINFREYGSAISIYKRGMRSNQQLLVPMYPAVPSSEAQDGIKAERNSGDIIIVTGGGAYKIVDEADTYLNLMRDVLVRNKSAYLYFMGGGDSSHIKEFIARNDLSGRFFFLGMRDDFYRILSSADIYVGTYPIGGGLMTQYCAAAGVPFVSFAKDASSSGKLLSVLSRKPTYEVCFGSRDSFLAELDRLVRDDEYRASRGRDFARCVPSKEEFQSVLVSVLNADLRSGIGRRGSCEGYEEVLTNCSGNGVYKYYLAPLKYMREKLLFFDFVFFLKAIFYMVLRFWREKIVHR